MSKKLALFLCLFLILLLGWALGGAGCDGKRTCGPGAAWGGNWFGGCDINCGDPVLRCDPFSVCFHGCWACNFGCVSFCGCDSNRCFAAIAAAFDDPIVYSLGILRDVAKRERDGQGGLKGAK